MAGNLWAASDVGVLRQSGHESRGGGGEGVIIDAYQGWVCLSECVKNLYI